MALVGSGAGVEAAKVRGGGTGGAWEEAAETVVLRAAAARVEAETAGWEGWGVLAEAMAAEGRGCNGSSRHTF